MYSFRYPLLLPEHFQYRLQWIVFFLNLFTMDQNFIQFCTFNDHFPINMLQNLEY